MDLKALTPTQRAKIELAARAISEAMAENAVIPEGNTVFHSNNYKDILKEILNQTPIPYGLLYMIAP